MLRFWNKTKVVAAVIVLAGMALSAAPAGALYCNDDPCRSTGIVCSYCSYIVEFWDGTTCRVGVFYCVDCNTGEWIHWDESVEYCIYGRV